MDSVPCPVKNCQQCGDEFSAKSKKQRFCSSKCRYLFRDLRRTGKSRVKPKGTVNEVPCQACGGPIVDQYSTARYCPKPECQSVKLRRQYEVRKSQPIRSVCVVDGCEGRAQAKGMCSTHYSSWWRKSNPDKNRRVRQKQDHRRRALKSGAFVEDVDRLVVLERDGWKCHLCGEQIPRDVEWPDLMYPTIDHVVPLAEGGEHSYANVAAAHWSCNAAKSNRGGGEQLALM